MKKTILIAEDDKLLSSSLEQALKGAGYDTLTAFDGEEALKTVKAERPDLVLLDVVMPKLDGLSVLWEMKADSDISDIPAVVLTNMGDMDTVSQIMSAGGTDYLLKSDQSLDMILDKINEVLTRVSKK